MAANSRVLSFFSQQMHVQCFNYTIMCTLNAHVQSVIFYTCTYMYMYNDTVTCTCMHTCTQTVSLTFSVTT